MSTNPLRENVVKNVLIIIIAALLWPVVAKAIDGIKVEQTNNFLVIISILLFTACFAAFAFTYEKSTLKTVAGKLLAHTTTFVFMLLIALLLESMVLAVWAVYPSFYAIIFTFAMLLYIGVVLYDFWDYLRAKL